MPKTPVSSIKRAQEKLSSDLWQLEQTSRGLEAANEALLESIDTLESTLCDLTTSVDAMKNTLDKLLEMKEREQDQREEEED